MVRVVCFEHDAVTFQSRQVYIIHRIIFQYHSIVTCLIGITKHHLQLLFCAMIVTFMIALECASRHIVIDINRADIGLSTRHVDG